MKEYIHSRIVIWKCKKARAEGSYRKLKADGTCSKSRLIRLHYLCRACDEVLAELYDILKEMEEPANGQKN